MPPQLRPSCDGAEARAGKKPQECRVEYADLSLAQVHATLAYYNDHRAEIEAELTADEGAEERFELL